VGCQLHATSGFAEKVSMGLYGGIAKIVLSPREKAFPGTNRRLAAFKIVWWIVW
jgi:hypothetical protein